MKITSLAEAFIHGLSDTYSAEKQMTKALPKLAKACTSQELAKGFLNHLKETEGQIKRIDQAVQREGLKLIRIKCKAMEGLVEEGDEVIKEIKKGPVRDAMLIAGAQKVEHYEIASYGTLVELAKKLGYRDAAKLLAETLEEEKATDIKLSQLATQEINDDAVSARKKAA